MPGHTQLYHAELKKISIMKNIKIIKVYLCFLNIFKSINPVNLKKLLDMTNYDMADSQFLIKGFTESFKVGHANENLTNNKPMFYKVFSDMVF